MAVPISPTNAVPLSSLTFSHPPSHARTVLLSHCQSGSTSILIRISCSYDSCVITRGVARSRPRNFGSRKHHKGTFMIGEKFGILKYLAPETENLETPPPKPNARTSALVRISFSCRHVWLLCTARHDGVAMGVGVGDDEAGLVVRRDEPAVPVLVVHGHARNRGALADFLTGGQMWIPESKPPSGLCVGLPGPLCAQREGLISAILKRWGIWSPKWTRRGSKT